MGTFKQGVKRRLQTGKMEMDSVVTDLALLGSFAIGFHFTSGELDSIACHL